MIRQLALLACLLLRRLDMRFTLRQEISHHSLWERVRLFLSRVSLCFR